MTRQRPLAAFTVRLLRGRMNQEVKRKRLRARAEEEAATAFLEKEPVRYLDLLEVKERGAAPVRFLVRAEIIPAPEEFQS